MTLNGAVCAGSTKTYSTGPRPKLSPDVTNMATKNDIRHNQAEGEPDEILVQSQQAKLIRQLLHLRDVRSR